LDWIVMKCLEKDRARRYETANGLAADIRRHLDNEPVAARPPSALYQFQKLVRRNKLVFGSGAAIATVVVVGAVGSTVEAVRARRAELSQSHLRQEAQQARAKAEAQAYTSDMNLVQQAWDSGNLKRAQALLRAYEPKPGEPDLRGFEWRYLWNLCQDESRFSFTNFPSGVTIVLSPDGSFVAATSGHIVKLLDYGTQQEIGTLLDPNDTNKITALAFSPAATNILATGSANHVKIWNLTTGQVLATLDSQLAANVALAFSRDGKLLATAGGNDPTLELYDVEARTLIWTRTGLLSIYAVAFTPDGRALVSSGGESSNPVLWNLATGTPLAFPVEHRASVNSFDFSPDGRLLATSASDSSVIVWNFAERKLVTRLNGHSGRVNSARFSVDGHYLATCSADATVRLWDVASGEQRAIYRGHQLDVSSVAFSRDGRLLISSSWDRTVKVWSVEAPRQEAVLTAHKGWASSVEFSPDRKRVASSGLHEGILSIWDIATGRRVTDLPGSLGLTPAFAFSPHGEIIALVGEDRLIRLWDAATLAPRGVLTNDFDMFSLSFSPDSRILAVCGLPGFDLHGITNRLAFWDLPGHRRMDKLTAAAALPAVASFSHDGRLVAVGHLDGTVRIWDFETERMVAEFKEQSARIWSVAFSPDDAWLAAGGGDGALVFYDIHARRAFRPPTESSWWVLRLAFAPDGKTLASAEGDGTVKLLNVVTRRSALTLRGHLGPVSGVTFSRDGELMATCGADGTVRFWRAPQKNGLP
jgi:WD40 repeat protein